MRSHKDPAFNKRRRSKNRRQQRSGPRRGMRPVMLYSEHHILPRGRPFHDWRRGDAHRVRILCDEWHRGRWHVLFGNALPSEVVSLFLYFAREQCEVSWHDFQEGIAAIIERTDNTVNSHGRPALRLHWGDNEVEDTNLNFALFPSWVEKHLVFLFGPLRSVLGIHLLLKQVLPMKCSRKAGAMSFEDIHELAWHIHQGILTARRSGRR